jgi:hypothetical protein
LREHTDNLRNALLNLPAIGEVGFEGLLATILTDISGVPFRLAGGGSQFGVDGSAMYEDEAVCFEGKRYDEQIPRTEVLTKIAELAIRDKGNIDLWVLGATTQVRSSLVDDVRELGIKIGITTLVLDWGDSDLSPLAVALAMAKPRAAVFLKNHVKDSDLVSKAITALDAIRANDSFASHAARIRAQLLEPTTGAGLAKHANRAWLIDIFSSKRQARQFLRQPLAPGDKTTGEAAARDALVNAVKPLLTGKPDGKILAILGDDGNGKSWLVAQSWLSLNDKPLMVVFTADDFSETSISGDLTRLLIDKLIMQSGGRVSEASISRWRRKLDRWCKSTTPDESRLVVVIDGLNQRPEIDWARLIEAMASDLDRIGGRFVVTVRTAYYESRIRRRLYAPPVVVTVPEWTDTERDAILDARGIREADLRATVAASLRNPRLLGIALELLQNSQIQAFEELSVSRLLFEYMRVNESDAFSPLPAYVFARKLQDHAREIIDRVISQRRDDLKIFDGALEAVSGGRFFIPVKEDPTRYSLDEDGLTLALGFAILGELRTAHRNQRHLVDALKTVIDPINALDRTAEAVFAALTVACLDEESPTEIGATIINAFADLQNPNADDFPAFAALAVKRPDVFMQAAQRMCLESAGQPNFDWVEAALNAAKADDSAWSSMKPLLQSWLRHYSLSPEARMFSHLSRDTAEMVEEERVKRQCEIDTKMGALSASERGLLGILVRNDNGDLATLTRFALTLIAGKPLAPFAMALTHWSFANALNGWHAAPSKEFTHLIRLNWVDWREAREALRKACEIFEAADVSRTGKWAFVTLLRATGDPTDAARAHVLVEELTIDRPKFNGWRLVEKYCATDPCDPSSAKPENVTKTAEDYDGIDVSKIRLSVGDSEVDHFFATARPGIARFEPQVGVDKHREFIANVLERNGFFLRQGIFETRIHNALVTHDHAQRLVDRVKSGMAGNTDDSLPESDRWIVSEYHLLLAFPLLSASEQIEAMLSGQGINHILYDLMHVAKPVDEKMFETLLDKAVTDNDERAQFIVLLFGQSTATPVSQKARRHLALLVRGGSERVRGKALNLIAKIGDEPAIDAVVKSGWRAANIGREDERWYGSLVILEAAQRGMIPLDEVLDRIAPQLCGAAARRLGGDVARDVARCIDASIKSAAGLALDIAVPDIELPQRDGDNAEPPRYIASEKPSASADGIDDFFQRLSESNEAFEQRQKRAHAACDAFKAELTKANARIVFDRIQIPEFDAIAAADQKLAESWYDLFICLPKTRRAYIHNLGLLLAHALADWSPDKAVRLFTELSEGKPFVRFTYGRAGITLDALTLWSAKDHSVLDSLRFERLDKAGNDDELAIEVLAALWSGKDVLLKAYIQSRLRIGEPAIIARALMVAGLSDHNAFNDDVLACFKGTPGFIGRAQLAAMYAYERNSWSKQWFKQLRETQSSEDFWRYSILFTKIVDGRYEIWHSGEGDVGEPFRLFWPSVEVRLQNRVKKWQSQRQKKLFGEDAPPKAFLC